MLVEILMPVHVDSSTHVKLCMFQERCRSQQHRFFRKPNDPILKTSELQSVFHAENVVKSNSSSHTRKSIKRGKRKSLKQNNDKKDIEQKLFMIGVNAAGLFNKTESLMRIVSLFKPGVVFVQETKARRKNKLNLANYVCFEMIREDTDDGWWRTAYSCS